MFRDLIIASAVALVPIIPAQAEQFAVQLEAPYEGANAQLLETLKITEIESISEDGAHYIVLDAPNEANVEAFIFAVGHEAISLNALEANWSNSVMDEISMPQRLGFLRPIACDFCKS